jgi:hypothetical protein
MVELCFANIVPGTGPHAGKTHIQCCTALPYDYLRDHLDTAVMLVVLRGERFFVLGPAGALLLPASVPQPAEAFATA